MNREQSQCKCGHTFYNGFPECPMCKIDKEERIERFKEKMKTKCIYCIIDSAGTYCKLKPMNNKDYPHEFYRTDCHGIKDLCRFKEFYKE